MDNVAVDQRTERPIYARIETVEDRWIRKARSNPADFITYVTDGTMRPAKHHLEWLYWIFSDQSPRVNLVAPRGSGKTNVLNMAMAYMIGKKPWTTNFIGSDTFDLAKARLDDVKELVRDNERYKLVFPWVDIDKRSGGDTMKSMIVWASRWPGIDKPLNYQQFRDYMRRYSERKDPTLYVAGATSSVKGRRFNGLVLLDDVQNLKNSATPDQREKIFNWVMQDVYPCMSAYTPPYSIPRIVMISTRWDEDDVAGRLKEMSRRDGDAIWKTIELPAIDSDGRSYWPAVWPAEKLEEKREEVGEVSFQLQYMINPRGLSTGEFHADMFKKELPNPLPSFKELFISTDFAGSEKVQSDYTVFTALARDTLEDFNVYVLDMLRFKKSKIKDKVAKLIDFADKIYEQYGMLTNILFEDRFSAGEYQALIEKRPDLPVRVIHIEGDKEHRLRLFAPKPQYGKFYCNMMMAPYYAMVSELVGFPATHDDICDTLSLPFQLDGWKPQKRKRAGTKIVKLPKAV